MTALNPAKELHVRGVTSKRYPLNKECSVPGCSNEAESAHHIFGRKPPETDSWFVQLDAGQERLDEKDIVPHVTGLCGSGTTGHHGDVEEHRAWIKYRQEGLGEPGRFEWFVDDGSVLCKSWDFVGPLDPQPGEPARKKGRTRKKGSERSTRTNLTIKIPQGFADGSRLWDEMFGDGKDGNPYGEARQLIDDLGLDGNRPYFEIIMDIAHEALSQNGRR